MRLFNTGTDNLTGLTIGSVMLRDIGERTHKVHGPQSMTTNINFGSTSAALMATLTPIDLQTYSIGADGYIRLTVTADGELVDYYRITAINVANGYTAVKLPKTAVDPLSGRTWVLWKPTNIGQNQYVPYQQVIIITNTNEAMRSAAQGQIKEYVDRGILQSV